MRAPARSVVRCPGRPGGGSMAPWAMRRSLGKNRSIAGRSEGLAHHPFAPGPQRFGVLGIKGVGAHALADCAEGVAFQSFRDMAVLAIATPDHICRRDDAGPDRRRRSL